MPPDVTGFVLPAVGVVSHSRLSCFVGSCGVTVSDAPVESVIVIVPAVLSQVKELMAVSAAFSFAHVIL